MKIDGSCSKQLPAHVENKPEIQEAARPEIAETEPAAGDTPVGNYSVTDNFTAAEAAGPEPTPGPTPEHWDPRLSNPNLDPSVNAWFQPAQLSPGEEYLHTSSVHYQDQNQAGGRHHIYAFAPEGVDIYALDYNNNRTKLEAKYEDIDRDGTPERYFEMPMWSNNEYRLQAIGQPGTPYDGMQSDTVGGLKMPANHHVTFIVTYAAAHAPGQAQSPAWGEAPVEEVPAWGDPGNSPPIDTAPPSPAQTSAEPLQTAAYLNIRSTPELPADNSNRIGTFDPGTKLTVTPDALGQSRAGEWIRVQGRLPNGSLTIGWVHQDFVQPATSPSIHAPQQVTAPAQPSPATSGDGVLRGADGQPQNVIATNYTDLGRSGATGQLPHPMTDPEGFRTAVIDDLDNMQRNGIQDVRIWAADFPENNLGNDLAALSARVNIIAEEAAARGMTVTVDLLDGATMDKSMDLLRGREPELNLRIAKIVGDNARAANIRWSVGNEIGDPSRPLEFATWYANKAELIRQTIAAHGGDPSRQCVSAQLTPGAVGHPTYPGWPDARAAMEKIVDASDIVAIHFYAPGPPGQLPETAVSMVHGGITYPKMDWDSFQVWNEIAQAKDRPMTAGEFGIPRDVQGIGNPSSEDYTNWSKAWLEHLSAIGIDQVSFWQLGKNEGGHIDPASADVAFGGNADDSRALIDMLRNDGWFFRKP